MAPVEVSRNQIARTKHHEMVAERRFQSDRWRQDRLLDAARIFDAADQFLIRFQRGLPFETKTHRDSLAQLHLLGHALDHLVVFAGDLPDLGERLELQRLAELALLTMAAHLGQRPNV